jgi:hypothetical protein
MSLIPAIKTRVIPNEVRDLPMGDGITLSALGDA